MRFLWLNLLLCFNIYGADLPLVTVEANKIIPYHGVYKGSKLIKSYQGSLKETTLLLAAYIHTQSIGEKSNRHLGDKYGIAQVVINRLKYRYGTSKKLDDYLLKYSRTIRTALSNYFWIDTEEYYSQQCVIAAYNSLIDNVPKEFDVGLATRFYTKKDPNQPKAHHKFVKKFNHSFYTSKKFIKNNYEKFIDNPRSIYVTSL